jgi:hypothetical protein
VLDATALAELAQIMRDCTTDFPSASGMQQIFESGFVMCDAMGTPYDASEVVQQQSAAPANAIQPPSTCL